MPINKEVHFKFEELFFSTTDKKGIIQFGNKVFINISGYPEDTILGAPHNIIRHPDMPKAVFKLFWDTLQEKRPIGAYVKNLASDGSYYWVYAFAFPTDEGYLSIRFKPSSALFEKVQKIYQQVLTHEKKTSMEDGLTLLHQILKENGFETYEDFMVSSVTAELNAREEHILQNQMEQNPAFKQISNVTDATSNSLNRSFKKIDQFQETSHVFTSNLTLLDSEFRKLKFLSINMSTLANKLGDEAATLAVVSSEFSKLASEIESQMTTFTQFTQNFIKVIKQVALDLAALKNQMIMVDFFVKESIAENTFSGMVQNKENFTHLFASSTESLFKVLRKISLELSDLEGQLTDIRKLVSGMEIIKQTGAIEAARKDEMKEAFNIYVIQMSQFMGILKVAVTEFNSHRVRLGYNVNEVYESTMQIKDNINEVFRLALNR